MAESYLYSTVIVKTEVDNDPGDEFGETFQENMQDSQIVKIEQVKVEPESTFEGSVYQPDIKQEDVDIDIAGQPADELEVPVKKARAKRKRPFRKCIDIDFSSAEEKEEFQTLFETTKKATGYGHALVGDFLFFLLRLGMSKGAKPCVDRDSQEGSVSGSKKVSECQGGKRRPCRQRAGRGGSQMVQPGPVKGLTCSEKNGYQAISAKDSKSCEIFLTCQPSIQILINKVHELGKAGNPCPTIISKSRRGHAMKFCMAEVEKRKSPKNLWFWKSSPYLGTQYYVNYRMIHALLSSGIFEEQYRRFCENAKIGVCENHIIDHCVKDYAAAVKVQKEASCDQVLQDALDEHGSLHVQSNGKHSSERNPRHTNVTFLDDRSHKVLDSLIISRKDDACTQRHELLGTKRFYSAMDQKGVGIDVHVHDRNTNINYFIRRQRKTTRNQNDTWHAVQQIDRDISKLSTGAKKNKGITWHPLLNDKGASVKKHVFYCMKHSDGKGEKIRQGIDAITQHYQNKHDECRLTSNCSTDPNYRGTKMLLTDKVAVDLLQKYLRGLTVYQHPEEYIHCMDTYYVESFNNVLLIYIPNGILFDIKQYTLRTYLAVLDWNENVDGVYTRTSQAHRSELPCRQPLKDLGKKRLIGKTYKFVEEVWDKLATHVCQ